MTETTSADCCIFSDDVMKWSNNRSVTFTNWEYSPYPADIPRGDICVALHSISGRWENVSCQDDVENGVVCETAQSESIFCATKS